MIDVRRMKGVESREVAKDIFLFTFRSERDRDEVLEQPWSFDRALVVLKAVDNEEMVDEEDFCFAKFWIQLYNLPPDG